MTPDQAHALQQTMLNTELYGHLRAKQEALNIAGTMPRVRTKQPEGDDVYFGKARIEQQEQELAAAHLALKEAQDITKEWQAAMEAWKDLAQTLRDEIKACPNHEAHVFGKDQEARTQKFHSKENGKRVELGLKSRYAKE